MMIADQLRGGSCLTFWILIALGMALFMAQLSQGLPIIGEQTYFEDSSKLQGLSPPVYVYCDEEGTHINCMIKCKNMGHFTGHCSGDFTCDCF